MGMSELLTVKEAAELLKTSRVQVRRMIQNGDLSAVKVGRKYRIPLACLKSTLQRILHDCTWMGQPDFGCPTFCCLNLWSKRVPPDPPYKPEPIPGCERPAYPTEPDKLSDFL